MIDLKERFPNTHQLCDNDLAKFMLLLRKGVYPYEYTDSWERFDETTLPTKEDFYDPLHLEDITDEDYEHAQKVWDTFNIKNLGEYHDLYVQLDTLLLSDVYENFRDLCSDIYQLDPAHFVSAPKLAWQACLKMTKVKIELLVDEDMVLMFEEGTRGSICQSMNRHTTANNKYMKEHDENKPSTFLEYYDVNNLYGWVMSKKLPVGEFKWIKHHAYFTEDFIKKHDEDSDYGYLLEVDVKVPKHLWRLYKYLPFLPQRMKVNKVKKLIVSVRDKEIYLVHISALKQALNHGLKLKKLHRAIKFRQEVWLKPYIEMNTKLRTKARNDFEKEFFKLMNNLVFGKTMENVRNHRDIKLVTTNVQRKRYVSNPNYHACKQFDEELMAIEMNKTRVLMNKPVYLGQTMLDISKTLMYEFWYDYLVPKYGDKIKLCYMDTDSFIIYLETEGFYKDVADDVNEWFDISNYDKNDEKPLPKGINKKVLGKYKSELGGRIMIKFCAPRAKTYAHLLDDYVSDDDDENTKRAKGTKKCVIKKMLTFENYEDAVLRKNTISRSQLRFKSDCHNVCTEEVNKIAISYDDDKRIQTYDGVATYPDSTSVFKVCESEMLIEREKRYANRRVLT